MIPKRHGPFHTNDPISCTFNLHFMSTMSASMLWQWLLCFFLFCCTLLSISFVQKHVCLKCDFPVKLQFAYRLNYQPLFGKGAHAPPPKARLNV